MDVKKKKKILLLFKLDTNLDSICPEQQNTISVSAKLNISDVFFVDPIPIQDDFLERDLNDFHEAVYIEGFVVADVSMKKGGRKSQQDRFVCIPDLKSEESDQFFYGVFDGHGGSLIANILQKQLHVYLKQSQAFQQNLEKAVNDSFKSLNQKIFEIQESNKIDCGSTALCVVNQNDDLYIVSLGDSTCVIIKQDYSVEKLSCEHILSSEAELKRVEHLCTVLDNKQIPRINGEIAVTRAFGDKKHSNAGLIADPEIKQRKLTQLDKYLILGTDGFWDLMQFGELSQTIKEWDIKNNNSDKSNIEFISDFLLEHVMNKNTQYKKDNMTLLTIDLGNQMKKMFINDCTIKKNTDCLV